MQHDQSRPNSRGAFARDGTPVHAVALNPGVEIRPAAEDGTSRDSETRQRLVGRQLESLSFRTETPGYAASVLRLRYESAGTVEVSLSMNPEP